jgi:hypothetical protein
MASSEATEAGRFVAQKQEAQRRRSEPNASSLLEEKSAQVCAFEHSL